MQDIVKYLENKGVTNISKEDLKILEQFKGNKTSDIVIKELDFLCALNKILINQYSEVSIKNMQKINQSIDGATIIKLFSFYQNFKSNEKNEEDALRNFKITVGKVLKVNVDANTTIEKEVRDGIKSVERLKDALYLTMKDKQMVDKLLDNCLRRVKNFISRCDRDNLQILVDYLKNNYNFTDKELVDISSKCATFFLDSSAIKIENIMNIIENFRKFVDSRILVDNKGLLKKSAKDFFINSSSIMAKNPKTIEETTQFLMGKSIGEITGAGGEIGKLKGNFTPIELAKIYNESITALTISVEKIEESCWNISKSYEKVFKEKLSYDELINGRNFSSLSSIAKSDYFVGGKIDKIFTMLSMFISKEDMVNLLKNDFSFLSAPVEVVQNSLKDAVINSRNEIELKRNVLKKINNHFDMYGQLSMYEILGDGKIKIGRPQKVNVRDVDEKQAELILKALNANDDEIKLWKDGWNENIQYKELELEIALEDVLEQLDVIEDFLNEHIDDLDKFIAYTLENKQLLIELKDKYRSLVSDEKLNSELESLNQYVIGRFNQIVEQINDRFSNVQNIYDEEIERLRRHLLSEISKSDEHVSLSAEVFVGKHNPSLSEENVEKAAAKAKEGSKIYMRTMDGLAKCMPVENVVKKNLQYLISKCSAMSLSKTKTFDEKDEKLISYLVNTFYLINGDVWALRDADVRDFVLNFNLDESNEWKRIDSQEYELNKSKVLSKEDLKIVNETVTLMKKVAATKKELVTNMIRFKFDGDSNRPSEEFDAECFKFIYELNSYLADFKKEVSRLEKEATEVRRKSNKLKNVERRLAGIDIENVKKNITDIEGIIKDYFGKKDIMEKNKISKM